MNDYIYLITGVIIGFIIGSLLIKSKFRKLEKDQEALLAEAKLQAAELKSQRIKEAEEEIQELKLQAKSSFDENIKKHEAERESLKSEREKIESLLTSTQDRLDQLDEKQDELNQKSQIINQQEEALSQREAELASLTVEEAKNQIVQKAEEQSKDQCARIYKQNLKEMKSQASEDARDILLSAMQRYSAECASDRTTTTVYLPSDEIKGRIIGRDGRNIRTLESLTGANIIIDDTPETVVISCFNSYRREMARITLEQLIDDGRIHPNRIHEVISSVTDQMDRDLERSATYLCEELNIGVVSTKIYRQLGMLKYRFNAFQNLMQFSREVSCLMGTIAAEIGLDVRQAKRLGLLHAIGQSFDESAENNSAQMGADFLRREGEDEELCVAIENYKDTYTLSNGMDRLLHVAVQLSKNRPGTADEAMDSYVNRLHQIEFIMKNMDEVSECVVMQAGREVLVSIRPEKVKDNDMPMLAQDIAEKIQQEMTLPGAVQLILSRDLRVEATAQP
ncbi:Rnase Y domain-containing protein [Lentisphaera marina]|uniref:Rnase Y domain-containing protein n=1 Tax=Lentisphaera marina TaxID=1111041 RepID=UPI002366AAAC|nr:Rnase Y domain-containing protein [Lentisphaera marina]MDD7986860.1 Rnase Y domain-containing protein [Lentisphaera marina]